MSVVIEEHEIPSLPVTVDPEILGGTPVFRGTRVPVGLASKIGFRVWTQSVQGAVAT